MPVRRAVHRWTTNDRQLLMLLKIRHSRKCIAPIFNHVLSARLSQEGLIHGVSAPSLDAQYREMKGGGGGHEIYVCISSLNEDTVSIQYSALLQKINLAVRTLRLHVKGSCKITRHSTNAQDRHPPSSLFRNSRRIQAPELDDASAEARSDQLSVRSELRQFLRESTSRVDPVNNIADHSDIEITPSNNNTIPPTPRIYTDSNGRPAQARPLLLFRSANDIHFRSRRHADKNKHVPPPDKFNTPEYEHVVWPHLQRTKDYPSPFISFGQKGSDVIGRLEIARSEDFDVKKFLAIFAFNDLEASAAHNFGPESGPHMVRGLFPDGRLSDLPKGYMGSGEWLIWGFAGCEPIVVLDSYRAINLAKAIRSFKAGDIAALADVRESLKDVPNKWIEAVSYIILKSYMASKLPRVGTPAYQELIGLITKGRKMTLAADHINLSRLSVADERLDNEDNDTEEISPPHRHISSYHAINPAKLSGQPTLQFAPFIAAARPVVQNLNTLAARVVPNKVPQRVVESTPFWSPDPSEHADTSGVLQPVQHQRQLSPLREVVNLEDAADDDDDDDWQLVNDDLEESFSKSFPSASKRAEKIKVSAQPQKDFDMDFDIEDEDFPLPSIEKENTTNDTNSYGREDFLRGLAQHAVSVTPPVLDTPTKMPLHPVSFQFLNSIDDDISEFDSSPAVAPINKFKPYKAITTSNPTWSRDPISKRPGTTRINSRNDHSVSSPKFTTGTGTGTSIPNPLPATSVRTKVPVIVRKRLMDY